MLKSGMESLASSADSIDASNDSVNYAKMIEIFRRHDKKCCGYLNKNQYKKFLHDMKIYQTDEFSDITFRALVTENENDFFTNKNKNKGEVSDDDLPLHSFGNELGITFEMARVICETFGPSSKQQSRLRSTSNTSNRPNNLQSNDNSNENSNDVDNNNNSNENSESNSITVKENETEGNSESNDIRIPMSQTGSSIIADSHKSSMVKFERNSSAPIPKESFSTDFPFSKRTNRQKSEKKGFKTKICSLILFRGVDDDRDGKIDFEQFKSIAKIVDANMSDEDINTLFENCMPDSDRNLVTYANVAKQLFDVFAWGNEDPYQQKIVNNAPISRICLLI